MAQAQSIDRCSTGSYLIRLFSESATRTTQLQCPQPVIGTVVPVTCIYAEVLRDADLHEDQIRQLLLNDYFEFS